MTPKIHMESQGTSNNQNIVQNTLQSHSNGRSIYGIHKKYKQMNGIIKWIQGKTLFIWSIQVQTLVNGGRISSTNTTANIRYLKSKVVVLDPYTTCKT